MILGYQGYDPPRKHIRNIRVYLPHSLSMHTHTYAIYQSQVSFLGPVGYGPTTLPLSHSDSMCPT